jgi:hypothetical protein
MISINSGCLGQIRRQVFTAFFTVSFLPLSAASGWTQVACKPFLSVTSAHEVRPSGPTFARKWIAIVVANTRHCATGSGPFEIDFVRIKENSPDLQFTEKFRWQHDESRISTEMNSDESILTYRIGFIAPCVCRSIAELSEPEH